MEGHHFEHCTADTFSVAEPSPKSSVKAVLALVGLEAL